MSRDYFCKKYIAGSDIERQQYYGELGGEVLLDNPKAFGAGEEVTARNHAGNNHPRVKRYR